MNPSLNPSSSKDRLPIQEIKVSEVELVYKSIIPASTRTLIKSSYDGYQVLLSYWDLNKIELLEQFKVLMLNRANAVLAISAISTGGITGTVVDIRLILATALKLNATSLILAHNHPSGNLTPSVEDKKLTQKIKQAGSFMDIKILDHIILTREAYYSFADEGKL